MRVYVEARSVARTLPNPPTRAIPQPVFCAGCFFAVLAFGDVDRVIMRPAYLTCARDEIHNIQYYP